MAIVVGAFGPVRILRNQEADQTGGNGAGKRDGNRTAGRNLSSLANTAAKPASDRQKDCRDCAPSMYGAVEQKQKTEPQGLENYTRPPSSD